MMMLTVLAVLICLIPFAATTVFAIEVLFGLRRLPALVSAGNDARAIIVIPANDEAVVITQTVSSLIAQGWDGTDILVVADNCTDDTAALAAAAGARVAVRIDPARRGKGFALAHARDVLASDPPAIVVVVDADCTIDRASLAALVTAAANAPGPVQSVYLLTPDRAAPALVQVSNFAFVVRNLIRQRGLQRLSGSARLTGTGMAFRWAVYASAALATADIVEDLTLGIELAARGQSVTLIEDARILSIATGTQGTLIQRTRWEGGSMAVARRHSGSLVRSGLARGDPRRIWMGLSLAVPPLALLVALDGAAIIVAVLLGLADAAIWPGLALTGILLASLGLLVAIWWTDGRPYLGARAIIMLPVYLFWKIPLYLRMLGRKPDAWLRTGRGTGD